MRILGIDPGSRITGYGIIDITDKKMLFVEAAAIKLGNVTLAERLARLYQAIDELVLRCHPSVVAAEQVFVHKNVMSALKLGQARGVAIAAATKGKLPLFEYAPRAIKQAVVGTGRAEKDQVGHMVKALLTLDSIPSADAADALAAAICHASTHLGYTQTQKSSWRDYDRKTLR